MQIRSRMWPSKDVTLDPCRVFWWTSVSSASRLATVFTTSEATRTSPTALLFLLQDHRDGTAVVELGPEFDRPEKIRYGKSTALGAASGAVAGLVAITPCAGWVSPMGSIAVGYDEPRDRVVVCGCDSPTRMGCA